MDEALLMRLKDVLSSPRNLTSALNKESSGTAEQYTNHKAEIYCGPAEHAMLSVCDA